MKRLFLFLILILILVLLVSGWASATTYYLRADGAVLAADKANATGCGATTTAMNITQHNAATFAAGDTITLCDSGGAFRDGILTPPSSGSSGSVITYNASGTPLILGSTAKSSAGDWTEETSAGGYSNVYSNNSEDADSGYHSSTGNVEDGSAWTATESFSVTNVIVRNFKTGTIAAGKHSFIEIWNDSSGAPGSIICQSDNILMDSWATTSPGNLTNFTFTAPCALTSGLVYYFMINADSTLSLSNYPNYRRQYEYGWHYAAGAWAYVANVYMALVIQKTLASLDVWYASATGTPNDVFRDGVRLTPVAAKAALNSTSQWWWDSGNSRIYVYNGSTNPTTGGHVFEYATRTNGIDLNGKTYLTFSGLTVNYANGDGITSNTTGAGHLVFDGITSSSNFQAGMRISGTNPASNVTLQNSTFNWNGASGVVVRGPSANWTIQNNTFSHNTQYIQDVGEQCYSAGLYIYDGSASMVNILVQDNRSYSNGVLPGGSRIYESGACNGGLGLWFDTIRSVAGNYTDSAIMRYNLAYDNTYANLKFEHTGYAQMYGNVTYGAYGGAGVGTEIQLSDATHVASGIYNNLIYNNSSQMASGAIACMVTVGPVSATAGSVLNNDIRNNLCIPASGGLAFHAYLGFENDGTVGSGNVYTYNGFGAEGTNFIEWGASTYYSTYATWNAAAGAGTGVTDHYLNADPLFTNAAGGDFTLQATSPAIGKGANLGVTYNSTLDPKSTFPWRLEPQCAAWNIGAFGQQGCGSALWFGIP